MDYVNLLLSHKILYSVTKSFVWKGCHNHCNLKFTAMLLGEDIKYKSSKDNYDYYAKIFYIIPNLSDSYQKKVLNLKVMCYNTC